MLNLIDVTFPTTSDNLAFEETLLVTMETIQNGREILRFWEPTHRSIVLGHSNKYESEIKVDQCRIDHVPIYRRKSGGGTVVIGPGVLNYALILDTQQRPELSTIPRATQFILTRMVQAFDILGIQTTILGDSDICLGNKKITGSAQYRKRRFLLFHGTILVTFPLDIIDRYLHHPSHEPGYRNGRSHGDFLTHLTADIPAIKSAIQSVWGATDASTGELPPIPDAIRLRYTNPTWTTKF